MADLAGQYTELRRTGPGRMMGRCPLHEERTPSFSVDVDRQLFHCFGCHAGGDLFDLVGQCEGLDFPAALEFLARRAGVELDREDESPEAAARRAARARHLEALQRAAAFYARHLASPTSQPAHDARAYLHARGLLAPVCERFQIGYAPAGRQALRTASKRAGFTDDELRQAGLLSAIRGSDHPVDRFYDRIIFPVSDHRGRVVGFGARKTSNGRGPKYVNSPTSAIYRKGHLLYGAHLARNDAARQGTIIAVEGYTDVLALHQAGITNTVGLMGTAVTEHHLTALRRLAPTAVIAFDGDDAGADAIVRTGAQARASGIELRVAVLPAGSDPAGLLQHEGPDALRRQTETSTSLARFHVERELRRADLSTAEGKDALVDAVRIAFTWIPSSVLREELVGSIAEQLGVAASLVGTWMPAPNQTGASSLRGQPEPPASSPPSSSAAHDLLRARELLLRCLSVPDSAPDLLDDAQIAAMPTDLYERTARHIREHATSPTRALPHDDHELVAFIGALLSTLAPVAQSAISPTVGETGG